MVRIHPGVPLPLGRTSTSLVRPASSWLRAIKNPPVGGFFDFCVVELSRRERQTEHAGWAQGPSAAVRQSDPHGSHSSAQPCEHDERLRRPRARAFPTASRSSCGVSFHGTRPRAEGASSARGGPGPHCCHEQEPANTILTLRSGPNGRRERRRRSGPARITPHRGTHPLVGMLRHFPQGEADDRSPRRNQSGCLCFLPDHQGQGDNKKMNGIIYLVGLVVVIMAVLSFFGLR